MSESSKQVRALQDAIIKRAHELTEEHINQGQMTRNRIMEDARAKVKLMEQKELLAAKDNAERSYQRRVQASEIKLQAELDRNRWGLVQSVMHNVNKQVAEITRDSDAYDPVFMHLLEKGVEAMGQSKLIAMVNHNDGQKYAPHWAKMTSHIDVSIELSGQYCDCSGGVKLLSVGADMMVDNTFEGIIARRQDELMQIIFERLFARVPSMGVTTHG